MPRICLWDMATNSGPKPFTRFARATSHLAGKPATFAIVIAVVAAWAVSGPLFGFSEAWQLTINTFTTIVTFLMVFLIQNAQTRDTEAIQVKLDELIRATQGAHNVLLDVEDLGEEALDKLRTQYVTLAQSARDAPGAECADEQDAASTRQPAS